MNNLRILFVVLLLIITTSCGRQISPDVYVERQVGEASVTYSGTVRTIRNVRIEGGEALEENGLGIAAGGITGGVIGNAVGKGRGVPTVLGALAGAVTGSLVEKRAKQQAALEYVVELDNGGLMTIVQGPNPAFLIGQAVYVVVSPGGRSRLAPQ